MTNNGWDLPEHVLFDILLWLPVASLLRFKSVCKVWYALIESSTFITEHLHHSNNTEDALIAHGVERDRSSNEYIHFYMLIHGREYQKCSKLDHMQVLLTPNDSCNDVLIRDSSKYRLIGCCDGIVCLRTSDVGNLALCNPAMKQIKYLPKPSFPTPPAEEVSRFDGFHVMGFGFDWKSDDYKVVRVLFYAEKPGSGNHNMKIVEVYSKRANSWRTLDKKGASLPFKCIDKYPQATNKDGTCFWTGLGFDYTGKLVSFDLNDEAFGMMSLPDGDLPKRTHGLDILNDKLMYMRGVESECTCLPDPDMESYCECLFDQGYKFFEIWMLGEFGIHGSWDKIYKIGPIFQERPAYHFCGPKFFYCPIRLSKNGEFVVLIQDDNVGFQIGELHLYNLRIQDDQLPSIHPPGYLAYELFHYSESLVSVIS